jgi:hypothetical protein
MKDINSGMALGSPPEGACRDSFWYEDALRKLTITVGAGMAAMAK